MTCHQHLPHLSLGTVFPTEKWHACGLDKFLWDNDLSGGTQSQYLKIIFFCGKLIKDAHTSHMNFTKNWLMTFVWKKHNGVKGAILSTILLIDYSRNCHNPCKHICPFQFRLNVVLPFRHSKQPWHFGHVHDNSLSCTPDVHLMGCMHVKGKDTCYITF